MPHFTRRYAKPVKGKRTTTGETAHQLPRRIVPWFKKQYPGMQEFYATTTPTNPTPRLKGYRSRSDWDNLGRNVQACTIVAEPATWTKTE
jgi:hypothetical protein